MDPAAVFNSLKALGGRPPYTVVIGCEVGSVEEGIGLTDAVARAVPRAIDAVAEVVAGLRSRSPAASAEGRG
jgi:hydrogenase maturation protease